MTYPNDLLLSDKYNSNRSSTVKNVNEPELNLLKSKSKSPSKLQTNDRKNKFSLQL